MAAPYNAVGFTGKSYDAKAGLINFGSRWYSPNEGRFTMMDTFPGWSNLPASLNRFSYIHNNPVNFTDPTGHCISVDPDAEYCDHRPPRGGDDDNDPAPNPGSGGSGGSGGGGPVTPPRPPPVPTLAELIALCKG